jgi:hypothetical protein
MIKFQFFKILMLFVFIMHVTQLANASGVSISWNDNSESDVAGYKVYYGTATHNYQNMLDVGPFTSAVIDGLNVGATYYFAVTAYDTSGNESAKSQEIQATMPAPPVISCSATSFTNSCAQGNNASSQTLQVWNSGTGTLSYNVSTSQSWITCAQSGGSSTGSSNKNTLTFNYSTSNLAAGTYTATITISASGASNTPQTILVALTVLPASATLTISKTGTGTGKVTTSPAGATFSAGTTVTLTATPDSNSVFAGWSGGCTGYSTTCTVKMNSNVSVSAAFNLKTSYTITASAGPGGSISPSGSSPVNSGSYKTFTITPGSGYRISSVKVDGISISPITSYTFNNINKNHTISASFTRKNRH